MRLRWCRILIRLASARTNLRELPAAANKSIRSNEHLGAADRFRISEAGAVESVEGNCARAEPSDGHREACDRRHQETRSAAGAALQQDGAAAGGAGCLFPQGGRCVAGFLNEDDMPQLRLSPTYRRLLTRDAADKEVRNYVKERFTAAIQLMKKHRAAEAHHSARVSVDHRAAAGISGQGAGRSEADDDQRGCGRSRRASLRRKHSPAA